jgi:sensor histidine kinase regulating citrate/malate metabolism
VESVLQNQYQQYKQSRESIDLINYKYHDLKHQIAVLRSEQDAGKRNEFLNRMEEEIRQYELQNKTGNSVLDTVLTSKNMYCDKHGITLTSVVQGELLDFMDTMDICSIFGNALDNAIECELKIPDKEKRLIHVTVSRQKNFLMIRVENYFEGNLRYKEGRLATTKKEKEFHGYGIKSIKYIVNKYQGAVSINTDNNWFDLKLLIPLQRNARLETE